MWMLASTVKKMVSALCWDCLDPRLEYWSVIVDNPPPTPSHLSGHDVLNYDTKEDMDPSQSCRTILKTCDETSFILGLQAVPLVSVIGEEARVHSCSVDPGSSLVSVCQRSTFLPLFFRQSIQCCRVSPCEWHPKDTPPYKSRNRADSQRSRRAGTASSSTQLLNMSCIVLYSILFIIDV